MLSDPPAAGDRPTPSARGTAALRRAYDGLVRLHGCPREIARGMALGLFIGMTPSMGVQMPIAVALASLLRVNKLSAAMGVWITNPVTAPMVYGFTYLLGAFFVGHPDHFQLAGDFSFHMLRQMFHAAPHVLWAMTVGGVISGIPIALAGYWLTLQVVRRHHRRRRTLPACAPGG